MNKHESEVIMAQLMSERKTLRSIEAVYEQAMRDIDRKLRISDGKINTLLSDIDNLSDEEKSILQSQIYQRKFQRSLKSQLNIMLKDLTANQYKTVNEYLISSYHNGYIGSLYNLNIQGIPIIMPIDPYLVHKAIEIDSKISEGLWQNLVDKTDLFKRRIANHISRGIATAASYKDIAVWLRVGTKASIGRTMTVARTEGNRIYNAAALDCGKGAKKRGCDLVKVWDCTLDMKTRPTHRECDGQVRELEESFKNANGEAKAPGQFGIASEDINCRCAVLIKPRWDVDGSFTKMNNETGQLEGFEDVKEYAKFKKRFWEETEKKTSENKPKSIDFNGGSGIIKSIDVDDYELATYGKNILPEVNDMIVRTMSKCEKEGKFVISEISTEVEHTSNSTPVFQIEPTANGLIKLNINSQFLSGKSLEEINDIFAKTDSNLANTLEEAIVHESGHAVLINGKTPSQVKKLYQELESKRMHGVSRIALYDGAECLAELEILRHRKVKVSKELADFYEKYMRRKYL